MNCFKTNHPGPLSHERCRRADHDVEITVGNADRKLRFGINRTAATGGVVETKRHHHVTVDRRAAGVGESALIVDRRGRRGDGGRGWQREDRAKQDSQ